MVNPDNLKPRRKVTRSLWSLTNTLILIIILLLIGLIVVVSLMGGGDGCKQPVTVNNISGCCGGACRTALPPGAKVNTVPEPSTLLLLGIGVAMIIASGVTAAGK